VAWDGEMDDVLRFGIADPPAALLISSEACCGKGRKNKERKKKGMIQNGAGSGALPMSKKGKRSHVGIECCKSLSSVKTSWLITCKAGQSHTWNVCMCT